MRLFLARSPSGRCLLVKARSLEDVANTLDELGDPGSCQVVEYRGPLAVEFHVELSDGDMPRLAFEQPEVDDAHEMLQEVCKIAYPAIADLLESEGEPSSDIWAAAITAESNRSLQPSDAWAAAVAAWWTDFSGVAPDRSAALRQQMNVSIPGEPQVVTKEQQALFDASNRHAMERVAKKLAPPITPAKRESNPKQSGKPGIQAAKPKPSRRSKKKRPPSKRLPNR